MPPQQLHIAIVGGGIAGLMLAIGLQARGISYTVYERAPRISELGAGIGFSPNAEAAMRIVDPAMHEIYLQTMTPNGEDYFQWVDGMATDEIVYRLYLGKGGFPGSRRSHILQAWAKFIPPEHMQFGKEVAQVVDNGRSPIGIAFSDGTKAEADVVIGCDGIWSRVRSILFGDACRATYTHDFCFRTVVPIEAARAALGDHRSSTRFMYNGSGAHIITYPVAKGAMLNVLVVVRDPVTALEENAERLLQDGRQHGPARDRDSESDDDDAAVRARQSATSGRREEAEQAFSRWTSRVRGVVGLLPDRPDRWAIFDMLENPAPSYAKGRVALAGDAAHAAGPHLGAGAGFGVEDAMVLATLLGDVHQASEAEGTPPSAARLASALQAYSSVRYERTQWLVKHSRDAVDLFHGRDAGNGQDHELFAREITWRFHHIWHAQMDDILAEARRIYAEKTAA